MLRFSIKHITDAEMFQQTFLSRIVALALAGAITTNAANAATPSKAQPGTGSTAPATANKPPVTAPATGKTASGAKTNGQAVEKSDGKPEMKTPIDVIKEKTNKINWGETAEKALGAALKYGVEALPGLLTARKDKKSASNAQNAINSSVLDFNKQMAAYNTEGAARTQSMLDSLAASQRQTDAAFSNIQKSTADHINKLSQPNYGGPIPSSSGNTGLSGSAKSAYDSIQKSVSDPTQYGNNTAAVTASNNRGMDGPGGRRQGAAADMTEKAVANGVLSASDGRVYASGGFTDPLPTGQKQQFPSNATQGRMDDTFKEGEGKTRESGNVSNLSPLSVSESGYTPAKGLPGSTDREGKVMLQPAGNHTATVSADSIAAEYGTSKIVEDIYKTPEYLDAVSKHGLSVIRLGQEDIAAKQALQSAMAQNSLDWNSILSQPKLKLKPEDLGLPPGDWRVISGVFLFDVQWLERTPRGNIVFHKEAFLKKAENETGVRRTLRELKTDGEKVAMPDIVLGQWRSVSRQIGNSNPYRYDTGLF